MFKSFFCEHCGTQVNVYPVCRGCGKTHDPKTTKRVNKIVNVIQFINIIGLSILMMILVGYNLLVK